MGSQLQAYRGNSGIRQTEGLDLYSQSHDVQTWHTNHDIHTCTHTHASFTAIHPGECGLASFPLTLTLHTSHLTPSHHVLLRRKSGKRYGSRGREVDGTYIP